MVMEIIIIALIIIMEPIIEKKFKITNKKAFIKGTIISLAKYALRLIIMVTIAIIIWQRLELILKKKYIKQGKNCCINIGGELIEDKCKLENINKEIKLVELGNDGTKEYDKYCDKYKASNYTH